MLLNAALSSWTPAAGSDCASPNPEAGSQKSSYYDPTSVLWNLETSLQRPPSATTLLVLYWLPIDTSMNFVFLLGFDDLVLRFYPYDLQQY